MFKKVPMHDHQSFAMASMSAANSALLQAPVQTGVWRRRRSSFASIAKNTNGASASLRAISSVD